MNSEDILFLITTKGHSHCLLLLNMQHTHVHKHACAVDAEHACTFEFDACAFAFCRAAGSVAAVEIIAKINLFKLMNC